MNFWNLGINGTWVQFMMLPACKAGRKSTTGPLDMVPYPPDFLTDSQFKFSLEMFLKGIGNVYVLKQANE